MATTSRQLYPVSSLYELFVKADKFPHYRHLLRLSAETLGHMGEGSFDSWAQTLERNALELGEREVVDEVNYVRDMLQLLSQEDQAAGRT